MGAGSQHEITGQKPAGARLERIKASPLWAGDRFRTLQPVIQGWRDLEGVDADAR